MPFMMKYKTNDEQNFENFTTLTPKNELRLRLRYSKSGTLIMVLTDKTTNQTLATYENSSANGVDITPTKIILGADQSAAKHFDNLNIEKISVK